MTRTTMRIGIVNDLALAREALRRVVTSVPGYSVAWVAEEGAAAVRMARHDRPDVILMDLVMPIMDGVEATRQIMIGNPCPILLVTSSVSGNFHLVLQALGHGGLDAVNTPVMTCDGQVRDAQDLLARLDRLARSSKAVASPGPSLPIFPVKPETIDPPLVALGASTGGPEALARILEALPAGFPHPVVIIQHIGADFAPNLVLWLQSRCALRVQIAREGASPTPGTVSIAATNDHLIMNPSRRFTYSAEPIDDPFRPSVDAFFSSLASQWRGSGVAVLLTGMSHDGARGLLALRRSGWLTIAQDEGSCVVYGMPKAAAELNAASRILPLGQIPGAIVARLAVPTR